MSIAKPWADYTDDDDRLADIMNISWTSILTVSTEQEREELYEAWTKADEPKIRSLIAAFKLRQP